MRTFNEIVEERKKKKKSSSKKTFQEIVEERNSQKSSESIRRTFDDIVNQRTQGTTKTYKDDIAPVNTTSTQESGYFQKGALEDGNVGKAIKGTTMDAAEDVGAGAVGFWEKLWDGLTNIAAANSRTAMMNATNDAVVHSALTGGKTEGIVDKYLDMQEDVEKQAVEMVKKDLYDEHEVAKTILAMGNEERRKYIDTQMEKDSVLAQKSDALANTTGEWAMQQALNAIGMPWWATTAVSSMGGESENALNAGASYGEAGVSGMISAGGEVLSELAFGGMFGETGLDDVFIKDFSKISANKFYRGLVKLGFKSGGEGIEEVFSDGISKLGQWLTYQDEKTFKEMFASEEALEGYIDSFIGGLFLGNVSNAAQGIKTTVQGGDYASNLTKNENLVADKVYKDAVEKAEADGKKLTAREKAKRYDTVLNDMKKGYISTDTIEEVLGGETFKSYKGVVDNETALQKEFDTLNKMKQGEMTGEQLDRRAELKQQLEELKNTTTKSDLKTKLSDEVFSLVKDSKLAESYNQRAKRGQAFTADLTQYDTKYHDTIKKAVDSGILNDTRRTHEFVDLIANVSADKGVLFDFTNNENLKKSSFALDGKTVNGYVDSNGNVTLNIDSAKSLNSVVGREVTHVLEGTEFYEPFKTAVSEYAKTKGEYDTRLADITKLYQGVENTNPEAELIADLVGDYLFTDEAFVRKLSTENQNIFQKVYDEIKYLCKIATADSREARELEKVKKTFADLYRESGKAQKNTTEKGGVRYSLNPEIEPVGRSGLKLDEIKLASAYGKDNAQRFIDTSKILYIDTNKNRVSEWERRTGLQLPVGSSITNSKFSISNYNENVNNKKSNDNSNDIAPVKNSLSNYGERSTQHGDYAVSGEDIRLEAQDDIAPLSENVKNDTEYPDDYAPIVKDSDENITQQNNSKKAEYNLSAINSKILDLIQKVKSGIFTDNAKEYLSKPTVEVANRIKEITRIDVSDFRVAIEARQLEHIIKDHGSNGTTDRSMSNDIDIAKMEYVLNEPDSIVRSGTTKAYVTVVDGKNKPANTVLYEKDLGDNSYYVVQAVPDTKAKTLYVVSAFIGKKGYKKEALQTNDAKSPVATPKSENANASNKSITENEGNVNNSSDGEIDGIIKTLKDGLSQKRQSYETERNNLTEKQKETLSNIDAKIAETQAKYDGKKNKDTRIANTLLRRIESLKTRKANIEADYAKRLNNLDSRIQRIDDLSQKDYTQVAEIERAINRIDKIFEIDKAALDEEFNAKRLVYESKNVYIGKKAKTLYQELNNLKKGVRASEQLGYLLDLGYDWNSLKAALAHIDMSPAKLVNENSDIEANVRLFLDAEYDEKVAALDGEYRKRLTQLETEAENQRKAARTANQRRTKMDRLTAQVAELIGDTSTWVDKKLGLSYKVNTLRRNLRDIVRDENGNRDIKKADAIYDYLQGTYNKNEAKLNRESNRIKEQFEKEKINSAESEYIMMLGELRENPETTLTEKEVGDFLEKHRNKIDTVKVDRVIELWRKTADELFERVNTVLKDAGMKEIPYRKGYYFHFTEEQGKVAKFFEKALNWKTQNNEIPTDIAGLTEQFNPQRKWQSFDKQRKGDNTVYDFLRSADQYINGTLDWIYHIEDIQKRRAFENHIRYVHSEQGIKDKIDALRNSDIYDADELQKEIELVLDEAGNPLNNFISDFRTGTNTLAGKKSSMDRGMEELTNRKFYSTMTNLSNRVSANMVGGSISSALTNFIPITQSWGQVSPLKSLNAMRETIVSYFKDDGVVNKSDFLTNRLKSANSLYKTTWDKIGDKVGWLMESIDNFTSQTVWRSKYNDNISKGMSETAAIKDADQFAENVIAGRSRGNMPTIFDSKNPIIKTMTMFQLEVNNQYGYMFKDMPQDMKNEAKTKLVKGYVSMFVGAYAYNALFSAMTGRDAAFDPIGIIEELLRDIGLFGDDDDEEPADTIHNFADNVLEEVPFVSGLVGGGRVPISSAMPYDEGLYEMFTGAVKDISEGDWTSFFGELANPITYLLPPVGGGQIKKTVQGLSMFNTDKDHPIAGSYTADGSLRYPVNDSALDVVKAALFGKWANENARDYIENNRKPLKKKQQQEFVDSGMSIQDYWEYREGLSDLNTLNEKGDYVASLDLPVDKKNILINNIADRDEKIDLTDYNKYSDFEEFDFAQKNPEKFKFLQNRGVTVSQYQKFDEDTKAAYSWGARYPEKYQVSRAVTDDIVIYKSYTKTLTQIKADTDASGNPISGSRKTKVIEYINSLDLEYGQKIILLKSEYGSENTYNNDIVEYLNSRDDISYSEMKSILIELGFTVHEDGTIIW